VDEKDGPGLRVFYHRPRLYRHPYIYVYFSLRKQALMSFHLVWSHSSKWQPLQHHRVSWQSPWLHNHSVTLSSQPLFQPAHATNHRRSQGEQRDRAPPKRLAYVVLCFETRCPKSNMVVRLSSKYLVPHKVLGWLPTNNEANVVAFPASSTGCYHFHPHEIFNALSRGLVFNVTLSCYVTNALARTVMNSVSTLVMFTRWLALLLEKWKQSR